MQNLFDIPPIGMGTFGSDKYSPEQVSEAVRLALKTGYRLFDCAPVYGNETQIGKVFQETFTSRESGITREQLFIISKLWNDMHGPGDVLFSCARSLRDLRLDYLDLYFIHWPFPNYHAPGCDGDARNPDARPFSVQEYLSVWRQMERLVDRGLVRTVGMSNMTKKKLELILPHCRIKPAAIEMELHPAFQQPELFAYCIDKNIKPIGYCPIGSPNRPERDKTEEDIAATEMPEIIAIAEKHGVSPALICLKWAVQRGQIPIPFASREINIVNNFNVPFENPLTNEEMDIIHNADRNCRLIKGQVFLWEGEDDWRVLWDENNDIDF